VRFVVVALVVLAGCRPQPIDDETLRALARADCAWLIPALPSQPPRVSPHSRRFYMCAPRERGDCFQWRRVEPPPVHELPDRDRWELRLRANRRVIAAGFMLTALILFACWFAQHRRCEVP
jgi:hypothetical protein